jgi:hypothetical protein
MHPALPFQPHDGLSHLAACQLLDYLLQLWVFLTHDLTELDCLHAPFLKLRKDAACLDGFMLTCIAN